MLLCLADPIITVVLAAPDMMIVCVCVSGCFICAGSPLMKPLTSFTEAIICVFLLCHRGCAVVIH